jgi:hypothetical protein
VKNRIKKYIIIILVGFLSLLGHQTLTHREYDEKKMDEEENMFI